MRTPAMEKRIISSAQRLRCTARRESAATNSRAKSRSLVASMLLAVGASKPSSSAMARRSSGNVAPAIAPEPSGRNVQPLAAVGQAVGVAQKHLDVGQQPVRDQDGFGALQVGVGRAWPRLPPVRRDRAQSLSHSARVRTDLVNGSPNVEPQVGGNLFVAAAAAVQLVSRVADQRDQLLFDEVMHVFGFVVVQKCTAMQRPFRQSASGP